MKTAAIYKLNGKLYKTTNLDKKLSKLKSIPEILYKIENGTEEDLDKWIKQSKQVEEEIEEQITLYKYFNKSDNTTIISIYNNLNIPGYEPI